MEIKVEGKSKKYAELLKDNYSGKFSDLSSFLLYKYEYAYFSKSDSSFALNMNKLANDSLVHLEIFGKLITLLGGNPNFNNFIINDFLYLDTKTKLIEVNIRVTKEKIIKYTKNLNEIDDYYIKEILKKFIIEERKNLEILELLQLKNKRQSL